MPILIDLTPEEIAEIKIYTRQNGDAEAVRLAMTEYLRFARRMQLKAASGHVHMEENWRELEESELEEQNGGSESGTH